MTTQTQMTTPRNQNQPEWATPKLKKQNRAITRQTAKTNKNKTMYQWLKHDYQLSTTWKSNIRNEQLH